MDRRPRRPGSRRAAVLLATVAAVAATGCGNDDPEPFDIASPSAACVEAFDRAAESAERSSPEDARSPDIDALNQTLDGCTSSADWLAGARANPAALPLELDRETALDQLCTYGPDTAVCQDWTGNADGPAT